MLKVPRRSLRRLASRRFSGHWREHAKAVDFADTKSVYAALSTWDLCRSYGLLSLCRVPGVAPNAEALYKAAQACLGSTVTEALVRETLFRHFCAGETSEEVSFAAQKLSEVGVGGIFDYAAEADLAQEASASAPAANSESVDDPASASLREDASEKIGEGHQRVLRNCIDEVANASANGFAAIKLTGLCDPQLLERVSESSLGLQHLFQSFNASDSGALTVQEFTDGYDKFFRTFPEDTAETPYSKENLLRRSRIREGKALDYIEWTDLFPLEDLDKLAERCRAMETSPFPLKSCLRAGEAKRFRRFKERLSSLAKHAEDNGVRLVVDAEQTYFQPAIDYCVLDLQRRFNAKTTPDGRRKEPVVFHTYQCYLRRTPAVLAQDLERAHRYRFNLTAKLVRGAYMVTERALAEKRGVPSPIHDTIEHTHTCYNYCVATFLDSIQQTSGAEIMIASHNQDSIEFSLREMHRRGIGRDLSERQHCGVYFGQLLGMADHLTFGLAAGGYAALKYLPFGAVGQTMPYLFRRGQENSCLLGGVSHDLGLIRSELLRRLLGRDVESPVDSDLTEGGDYPVMKGHNS